MLMLLVATIVISSSCCICQNTSMVVTVDELRAAVAADHYNTTVTKAVGSTTVGK